MLDYAESSRAEAQQLAEAIAELDGVLARSPGAEAEGMRKRATAALVELRASLEDLNNVEKADIFGVDPSLATRRHVLLRLVEQSKVTFEQDILPALRDLARSSLQQSRQNPPDHVDTSELPDSAGEEAPPEGWSVDRVLDSAERFIGDGDRVVGLVPKVLSIVHALGMLASLVPA
jgi:hypothetical protein